MECQIEIMIVDDEYLECLLISNSFDWNDAQMRIVGTYESSKKALEAFEANPTDLVLTDINMPIMDGLELAGIIKERRPETEVVIITGFDEFEYARCGINIGVLAYLLKPINRRELAEVLYKAKAAILNRRKLERERISIQKESFLQRLVSGRVGHDEFINFINNFDYGFLLEHTICAEIRSIAGFTDISLISNKIDDEFKECKHIVFLHYSGNAMMLFDGSILKSETIKDRLSLIASCMEGDFTGVVSEPVVGEDDIECAFFKIQSALGIMDVYGDFGIICYSSFETVSSKNRLSFHTLRESFSSAIKSGSKDTAKDILNGYLDDAAALATSTKITKIIMTEVVSALSDTIWEMGFSFGNIGRNEGVYTTLARQSGLTGARKELQRLLDDCITYGIQAKNARYPDILRKTIAYIDENYSDPMLSMKAVANRFYTNESHLSRTFKLHIGKTFVEYVLEHRMEKAKRLICSSAMRNYEIAGCVGINDPNYFGQCFKKYTGMTVNQYRKCGDCKSLYFDVVK